MVDGQEVDLREEEESHVGIGTTGYMYLGGFKSNCYTVK